MLTLIGDIHFGKRRILGATQESMSDYAEWQLNIFKTLIKASEHPILVTGDLFDSSIVPYDVVLKVIEALGQAQAQVLILKGNHDHQKDRSKLSSLDFISELKLPGVSVITKPVCLFGCALVPHMPNQSEFDAAVKQAALDSDTLITHCNYDNGFAVNSDHSLNLTQEQAELFTKVIIGHEHNKSVRGNVTAVGSMVPCAVGEAEPKFTHLLETDGSLASNEIALGDTLLLERDWEALDDVADAGFIKVTGTASAEEAPLVLKAVDDLRKQSSAFMIQNAVKVGRIDLGDLQETTTSDLEKFDALSEMTAMLTEDDLNRLTELGVI